MPMFQPLAEHMSRPRALPKLFGVVYLVHYNDLTRPNSPQMVVYVGNIPPTTLFRAGDLVVTCGWTKLCTTLGALSVGIYRGLIIPGFLGWCVGWISSIHSSITWSDPWLVGSPGARQLLRGGLGHGRPPPAARGQRGHQHHDAPELRGQRLSEGAKQGGEGERGEGKGDWGEGRGERGVERGGEGRGGAAS